MKTILKILIFTILTVLTQMGGIIYIVTLVINKKYKFRFKGLITFSILYLLFTFLIIPYVAPFFGREKINNTRKIHPTSFMTILLNRNYVRPELNKLLEQTEGKLKNSDIGIHYLDANFPFINSYPLLPHLSHNDGRKLDLSLIYETKNGIISQKQKSVSGYGIFEGPYKNETNQIFECINLGYIQYDYPKDITFGAINKELIFSEKGNQILINTILENENLEKLFIEPHLKERLSLSNDKIRYHGCKAVRHDDHIHIQIKK